MQQPTVEIPGAWHVVGMSHPRKAVQLVREAAEARTAVGS